MEAGIVATKREKPHWGARKIRERLLRLLPHAIKVPGASTVHAVLDRHGLVKRMSRARTRAEGTPLSDGLQPNDLLPLISRDRAGVSFPLQICSSFVPFYCCLIIIAPTVQGSIEGGHPGFSISHPHLFYW